MTYNNFDNLSTKRVSFIMATKNRAHLMNKVFSQVKKIKGKDDEFILIDGGSTDNTIQIIQKHKSLVDIFLSEPDLNTNHAYNKGILVARGKYVKYMCDDDIIYPKPMRQAIKIMEENPKLEVMICGGVRYRRSTGHKDIIYLPPGTNYGKSVEDAFKHGTNGIGFFIRRSAYTKAGIAPFDWNADLAFIVNCIKNNVCVKFCRIKLYYQVIYDFSINNSKKTERRDDYLKLLKENASRRRYYTFALNLFLHDHKTLAKLLKPVVFLSKMFRNPSTSKSNVINFIWDGGFS